MAISVLTTVVPSEKVELLLDGIGRLGNEKPPDFEEKVKGLRTMLDGLCFPLYFLGGMPIGFVIQVWLDGKKFDKTWFSFRPRIFEARCAGLAARLWAGKALPLLASPTHTGGWLDPIALVRRVKIYQEGGRLLDCSDEKWPWADMNNFASWLASASTNEFAADAPEFIQALLRLAPEGRLNALSAAQSVKGDYGRALRFALGEGEVGSIERPEFAVAAFRSRFPRGICEGVSNMRVEKMPDGIYPAKYTFSDSAVEKSNSEHYRMICNMLPDFLTVANGEKVIFPEADALGRSVYPEDAIAVNNELLDYLLFPTVSIHSNVRDYTRVEDFSTVWMQNKEPFLARLAKEVLLNINSTSSDWHNDFTILFDPDFPLYENGSWCLALALVAKPDQLRRLGLDLLIAAVEENRVDANKLAKSMSLLSKVTQSRWTAAIRELARVSALHALFAWKLLCCYLVHKGDCISLGFLEVMLELKETYGFGLTSGAVDILQRFKGSGKTAKVAKTLAADGVTWKSLDSLHGATEQSLKARIARVERWQRTQYYAGYSHRQ
jgi:hypothetical protein